MEKALVEDEHEAWRNLHVAVGRAPHPAEGAACLRGQARVDALLRNLRLGQEREASAALLRAHRLWLRVASEDPAEALHLAAQVDPSAEELVALGQRTHSVLGMVVYVAVPRLGGDGSERGVAHAKTIKEHLHVGIGAPDITEEEGAAQGTVPSRLAALACLLTDVIRQMCII